MLIDVLFKFCIQNQPKKEMKDDSSNKEDKNIILARNRVPIEGSTSNGQEGVGQVEFLRIKKEDLLKIYFASKRDKKIH